MQWLQRASRSNLDNCTSCGVKLDASETEKRKYLKGIIYDQKQIIRTIHQRFVLRYQ
jgi:hypothetical protein